jgi:AcrR family transcriptional regulator
MNILISGIMGRRAHFKHEDFIEAAIGIIAERGLGGLTISALSERIKAPVGSVYHRFPSRDAILAELWLTIVESFQKEFLKILKTDGLQAALYGLRWVREHPNEGRILLLYRREDIASGKWPIDLQKRAQNLTKEMNEAIHLFTQQQFGRVTGETINRTLYILRDAPGGIIRRYLEYNKIPPESVCELIRETYVAVMKKVK